MEVQPKSEHRSSLVLGINRDRCKIVVKSDRSPIFNEISTSEMRFRLTESSRALRRSAFSLHHEILVRAFFWHHPLPILRLFARSETESRPG